MHIAYVLWFNDFIYLTILSFGLINNIICRRCTAVQAYC